MNERIKELAEQAGAIPIHEDYKNRALVGLDKIEKFAELIIKECVGLAKLANLSNTPLDVVKDLFGVE